MVGTATPTGLEPATSAVTGRRASQLRYGAMLATIVPVLGNERMVTGLTGRLGGLGQRRRPAETTSIMRARVAVAVVAFAGQAAYDEGLDVGGLDVGADRVGVLGAGE